MPNFQSFEFSPRAREDVRRAGLCIGEAFAFVCVEQLSQQLPDGSQLPYSWARKNEAHRAKLTRIINRRYRAYTRGAARVFLEGLRAGAESRHDIDNDGEHVRDAVYNILSDAIHGSAV